MEPEFQNSECEVHQVDFKYSRSQTFSFLAFNGCRCVGCGCDTSFVNGNDIVIISVCHALFVRDGHFCTAQIMFFAIKVLKRENQH
jgi:hypothetical protein